jgi:adiponectin receptor
VLIAFGLSWHVYGSWLGTALNTGAAAAVAAAGVAEVRGLQPHFQRHRGQMVAFVGSIVLVYWWPMAVYTARRLAAGRGLDAASGYALATFGVLQAGGWVFAAGLPEKALPGVFDLCGFSHQLMHVAVMVAHVLEYLFVWCLHTSALAAVV